MQRRDILKFAASLTGTAILSPLSTAMLSSVSNADNSAFTSPQFFERLDLARLSQIMDVILPKTDTPSASAVNTHGIMDNMFAKVFLPQYKKQFMQDFSVLKDHLDKQGFTAANAAKKLKIIKQLELKSLAENSSNKVIYKIYTDIKQQTISYYLTSEEIAEKHLNYLPIPGGYDPCITVEEVGGKAWAE